MSTAQTTAQQEEERRAQLQIEECLRSVLAIPFEQCPWPAVRNALFQRVLSGANMRTYAWYSATVYKIEDNTYPDKPWFGSPREWALHNGFAVE